MIQVNSRPCDLKREAAAARIHSSHHHKNSNVRGLSRSDVKDGNLYSQLQVNLKTIACMQFTKEGADVITDARPCV